MIFDYINCFFGVLKMLIFKLLYLKRITFKSLPKLNLNFKIAIKKNSKLIVGRNLRTRNNVSFRIYNSGIVNIGDNCFFNDNCSINCQKNIQIGSNVICGQNVVIIDNDHDYRNNINNYICNDIIIGNNVWIGANCIILKGVTIGDNVIIAAGTIVKENIPLNKLAYNEKKVIYKAINKGDKKNG